jgi:hypothetical protein
MIISPSERTIEAFSLSYNQTSKQSGDPKMSDDFNMSMRKFLKQVGVTSQQAIEEALRKAGDTSGRSFEAKVVLTIDGLELEHVVTGTIEGQS